jgi:hypothetical protein
MDGCQLINRILPMFGNRLMPLRHVFRFRTCVLWKTVARVFTDPLT